MKRGAALATAFEMPPRAIIEDRCAEIILERLVQDYESYLKYTAGQIAFDIPFAVADMVQEACIALWQLDIGRFAQRDAGYLDRILCNRMIDVFEAECRGGLTSGWSKHS